MTTKSSRVCFPQYRKSIIVTLLLWNTIVSAVLSYLELVVATFRIRNYHVGIINVALLLCCLLGLLHLSFPFGGLLADICCSRHRIIVSSTIIIWCSLVLLATSSIVMSIIGHNEIILQSVVPVVTALPGILGLSGFMSNSVQFSLDQLLDAPSEELSLFLHWFVWLEYVGKIAAQLPMFAAPFCIITDFPLSPFTNIAVLAIATGAILLTSKQMSYYQGRVSKSPYWNVLKVLRFAAKRGKQPKHRSAFTYCDDEKPSKIDYAKKIYGGPFETEVVEDVKTFLKTFLKIVVMLLATALILSLLIPNFYLFPYFGLYLGKNVSQHNVCSYDWMLFESGYFSTIISVLFIPLYLQFLRRYIKNRVSISTRLGIGILLMVAATISMLIIDILATKNALEHASRNTSCFLLANYYHYNKVRQTLEYPSQILAITNFLYGVAAPLIRISVLEFISAQSPHAMKGLILGVFYAFKGLFILLGSVATFPFAQESLWRDQHGMFDCGFYYYLSNSVFCVFGLVVFILAARWYRNRERDDPPYSYQYAENYFFSRADARPPRKLSSFENYGTMQQ